MLHTPVYTNTMGYGVQVYKETVFIDNPKKVTHACGDTYFYVGPSITEWSGKFAPMEEDGTWSKYKVLDMNNDCFPNIKEELNG